MKTETGARTAAKTPSTAIARVLKSFGLKQGQDFRVRGNYQGSGANRERTGTYVAILSGRADQLVADHADAIEELAQAEGFAFRVSIHFTTNGRMWTWVANYGVRTRDAAPAATVGKDDASQAPSPSGRKLARDLKVDIVQAAPTQDVTAAQPVIKAKLGAPRPAFQAPDAHPYDGLPQRRVGALYWACQEADQVWFFQDGRNTARYTLRVYRGRAMANGWILTGPGLPSEGRWMGPTMTKAAEAAEDVILGFKAISDKMEATANAWPTGTRVTNGHRIGTVNGAGWGVVTAEGHENYGRAWVDIDWDAMDGDMGTNRRGRPFADTLVRHQSI